MNQEAHAFRRWHIFCAWVLLVSIFIASCSSSAPINLPSVPGISPPSEDEDARISREFRREAKKQLKFVEDPEVDRYVDGVGRRILSAWGPQPFDYRYFVIDEPVLNAFAVPGGSIYIYAGIIDRARSTDELAAVMAHETTHVAKRHMARMSGLDPVSLLGMLGAVLAARSGGAAGAQAAAAVSQGLSIARQIAYTRPLEMEADTLGLKYMTAAGYDPHAMLSFQKTMLQEQNLNPIDIPPYLLDHPPSQERVANIELLMRSMKSVEPVIAGVDPIKKIQTLLRLERREADKVIAEQEKALAQSPNNSEAYQLLGIAYFSKGMWQEARSNLEKATALNPRSPGIDRDLGRLYTQTNDYGLAHAAFDRSLAVESKEALNYLFLGELLEKEGDLRGAVGAYLNGCNFAPLWDKPPYRLGIVYGKLDRLGDAYYYLGQSLLLQDEDEKAAAALEKAVKILGVNSPRGQLIQEELKSLKARKR
ncbi:MAG TPA: M48 family metalloprotease [Methylomirabilota bacterium]|nr:M48 family metalloprotease [Methylomirabilota bacterium]